METVNNLENQLGKIKFTIIQQNYNKSIMKGTLHNLNDNLDHSDNESDQEVQQQIVRRKINKTTNKRRKFYLIMMVLAFIYFVKKFGILEHFFSVTQQEKKQQNKITQSETEQQMKTQKFMINKNSVGLENPQIIQKKIYNLNSQSQAVDIQKQELQKEKRSSIQYLNKQTDNIRIKKSHSLSNVKQQLSNKDSIEISRKSYIQDAQKWLNIKSLPENNQLALSQYQYYEKKYQISSFSQLPFCIVVPTYNNIAHNRYLNNLKSIAQQNYSNYHVVIIDDASDDGTFQAIVKQIGNLDQDIQKKISMIHNKQRKFALFNIYSAAHEKCNQNDLMMVVDGDDELIGKQVFKFFNSIFMASQRQNKPLWFAYSNFITPKGQLGFSRPYSLNIILKNQYRKSSLLASHLRVFYTQLFRKIKKQDLQDENKNFYHAANDVAMCVPMLEMSHQKVKYIQEINYLYNLNTGYNNYKTKRQQQINNTRKVRQGKQYQPLDKLFS